MAGACFRPWLPIRKRLWGSTHARSWKTPVTAWRHGDDGEGFFMNIGRLRLKNAICLAPMAGITDLPFRTIVREFGCGLAFTEMVSANGLVRGVGQTCRYLDSSPADRPLGVQLFGSDPETLAEAVRMAGERGAALIDG